MEENGVVSTNLGLFMSHKMLLLNDRIPAASETRPWSKLSFEYDKALDKVHMKHICHLVQ